MCHRDIKPSNILINSSNEAKYCDFGSAKILDEGGKNVVYICSRYYRAPELILGSTAYGKEIDIWSLGCVLAEMLVNKALFDGSNSTDMLIKIFQIVGSPTAEDMAAIKPAQTLDIAKVKPYGLSNRIFKLNPNASPGLV